jgi:hypothetical protein
MPNRRAQKAAGINSRPIARVIRKTRTTHTRCKMTLLKCHHAGFSSPKINFSKAKLVIVRGLKLPYRCIEKIFLTLTKKLPQFEIFIMSGFL